MVDRKDMRTAMLAALDEMREKMGNDADRVVYQLFQRTNYVGEDLGPVLAIAGASDDEARYAFIRMVLVRAFKYALTSQWGPSEREQSMATDFATSTLGHVAGALSEVVGQACKIAVVWEDDEPTGPDAIVPG
jgi:hypothetical protein